MDKELLDLTIDALGGVTTRLANEDRDKPLDRAYVSTELQDVINDMGELLADHPSAAESWNVYMMTWNDQANARETEHKQAFIRAANKLRQELVSIKGQLELRQD